MPGKSKRLAETFAQIPPREHIAALRNWNEDDFCPGQPYFTGAELEALDRYRDPIRHIVDPVERCVAGREILRAMWPVWNERVQKTHWIDTKSGKVNQIIYKPFQQRLFRTFWDQWAGRKPVRIILLKARQMGSSAFVQHLYYALCDEVSGLNCITINYDDFTASEMLEKSKTIHSRLWFPRPLDRDPTAAIEWSAPHGSSMFSFTAGGKRAGTSLTFQLMHITELSLWDFAAETLDNTLQVIQDRPSTSIIIESTANGAQGEFYERFVKAERGESDYTAFFAPWCEEPGYTLPFASGAAKAAFERSLEPQEKRLMEQHDDEWGCACGNRLSLEQMHWRRFKIRNGFHGSTVRFQEKFPITSQEAFLASGAPVFSHSVLFTMDKQTRPPSWKGFIYPKAAS